MSGESSGSRHSVRIFDDAAELTRAAAEEVTAALARGRAPARSGDAAPSLGLSGGSTPRALYSLLADAAQPFRRRIAWDEVNFFWGDERHVPPDDPDSNFRMAREALFDRVTVPAAHVHRIAAEEPDATRAAELYERDLVDFFHLAGDREGGEPAALDWPRFDVVLLGLGEEGHTASLFPGSPLLDEQRRLVAAVWVKEHDTWRITFTPPVLNHASTVIFLVSGAGKAPALAAVLEGAPQPAVYPAQIVAPPAGRVLWLVDRAAASQLRQQAADR